LKLAAVSIRRPVFTVMMIVALVVLGYTSFQEMNIDNMPDVDFPFVIVSTIYPGSGAEAVETEVTKKIEDAVNPISGLKHLTSISQEGYSLVFAEFVLEMDSKDAAQEVREKVSAIRAFLPNDIEPPVIARYDPHSEPIMSLTISGQRSLREITTFTKDEIKRRLEAIPGVGSVTLVGGHEREINVFLDVDGMESYEISIDKVARSLAVANLEIPGGRINEAHTEYLVRTMGRLTSVDQFEKIIIDNPHGQPVFLKDIATVIDGIEERRSLARVNGEEAVTLNVARQSGANTVDVAYLVKAEITRIQDILPPDMKINIVADDSTWIEDSIHEILTNIYFGGLLAVIVIFLFLADIRSTVISGLAIPTSIVATFTFMHILGFTLNTMSLMALSLAVGLLIDDAIVVIENIYRHMANGSPPRKAAFEATREIGLAVMATTFSIVVVFLPVAFMKGIVGRFFYEFGMTVAFAVVVSLFVAFSLTPMLASRWLKINDHNTEPPARFLSRILWSVYNRILLIIAPWNRLFNRLNEKYKSLLGWSLNHRFLVMLTAAVVFIGSLFMGGFLGSEFFPQTDQGKIRITVKTPPGTDMPTTSDRIAQIEEIAADFAGVDLIYTTIGAGDDPVNEGTIRIELVDKSERELSVLRIIDSMRTLISELPGIEFSLSAGEGGGGGEKPVEISIRGHDLDILTDLTEKVENIFRETPGAVDIENNLEANKPELKVTIDRDMANDLGVNIFQVASTIRSFVDGQVVTRYKEGDEEYDVRIRLKESMRSKASDIGRLLIASNKEVVGRRTFMVPLSNIAKIEKTSSIGEYRRYDRLREAKVGCNVSTGYFSGTMVQEILQKARQLDIPPGYHIDLTGTGEIQQEAFGYIFTALALAVIFIYLLLASQFESFFDPFSIMFSLPMSLVGAIVALLVFNSSLSIISLIGVILLMGLVTKNAILLIDFIKQNRYKGVERTESILIAGPIRLRPILMTTFAMIFGMLPLALGIGPGAEVRAPMARAVIGGLISSTMLTLIVVPVVYTIIDDIVAYFKGGETITVEKEAIGYAGSDS